MVSGRCRLCCIELLYGPECGPSDADIILMQPSCILSGTNIIKEYKDMFSKEKSDGSDRTTDEIADYEGGAALAHLKSLVESQKKMGKKDVSKWEFAASPHAQFGKSLDDTYAAFLSWARVKEDGSKVNVSKAMRRLESYAVSYLIVLFACS